MDNYNIHVEECSRPIRSQIPNALLRKDFVKWYSPDYPNLQGRRRVLLGRKFFFKLKRSQVLS